jgi:hypothetical protein
MLRWQAEEAKARAGSRGARPGPPAVGGEARHRYEAARHQPIGMTAVVSAPGRPRAASHVRQD